MLNFIKQYNNKLIHYVYITFLKVIAMLTQDTVSIYHIDQIPFFQNFPEYMVQELLQFMEPQFLNCGEVLFREGEYDQNAYLIVNGRISMIRESEQNKLLRELGRGEIIGEKSVLTLTASNATAVALRDSFLLKLSKASFENLNRVHPNECLMLIEKLLAKVLEPSKSDVYSKFTSFFVFMDESTENSKEIVKKLKTALDTFGSCLVVNKEEAVRLGDQLDSWLVKQQIHHRFIIYEADNLDFTWTQKYMRHSDRVLIFSAAGSNGDLGHTGEEVFLTAKQLNKATDLILIHKLSESQPTSTQTWLNKLPGITWHHIRENSDDDLQRIARIVSGNSISLVLGGGGAKALVFIGFYKALKELGIPLDWLGGSCAGSFLSAAMAMDWSPDEIVERVKLFTPKNTLSTFDLTFPLVSLSSGKFLAKYLTSAFGDIMIEDMWKNHFSVATNLTKSRIEIIRTGILWKALRASIGIPVVVHPVSNHEGDLLVDGALMNNLPVDLMKTMVKNGKIIAGRLKFRPLNPINLPSERLGVWNLIKNYFSGHFRFSQLNIFKILDRTTMLASRNHANETAKMADFCIAYEVPKTAYFQFGDVDRLVDLGYRVAMEHADELMDLKKSNSDDKFET